MLGVQAEASYDYYKASRALDEGDVSFTGGEGTLRFFASLVSTLQRWSGKVIYWDPVEPDDARPPGVAWRTRVRLYTDNNSYSISAVESSRGVDDSYMGCIAKSRTAHMEEDWNRGSDLPDGKLVMDTWHRITAAIVAYEIARTSFELKTYWRDPDSLNRLPPELAAVYKAMLSKPVPETASVLAVRLAPRIQSGGWKEVSADPLEYLRTRVASIDEAYEWLARNEPTGLGEGYFANVFDVGGTAVKVSREDRCWQMFAKYAGRTSSRYLPRVHWVRQVEGGFVAAMEKLSPVRDLDDIAAAGDPHIMLYVLLNFAYLGPAEYEYILRLFRSRFPGYDPKVVGGRVTDESYWDHPFVRIMADMEKMPGCRVDMHTENCMLRGRQLVIIDPIIRTKDFSPHVKSILRRVAGWREKYLAMLADQQSAQQASGDWLDMMDPYYSLAMWLMADDVSDVHKSYVQSIMTLKGTHKHSRGILYRGMGMDRTRDVSKLLQDDGFRLVKKDRQPIVSWSKDMGVATSFAVGAAYANKMGIVLAVDIPASDRVVDTTDKDVVDKLRRAVRRTDRNLSDDQGPWAGEEGEVIVEYRPARTYRLCQNVVRLIVPRGHSQSQQIQDMLDSRDAADFAKRSGLAAIDCKGKQMRLIRSPLGLL